MLDLKLLTTFREVAVRGSFSEAAVALDFTQPAVSQHISRLESALGTRVLERSARGVTLTPAGEVLVRHASALLDAARRAEEAVRDAAGIGRAQVRVGAFAVQYPRRATSSSFALSLCFLSSVISRCSVGVRYAWRPSSLSR